MAFGRALVVLGVDLVAEQAGRGADGLLDDPGALGDARDEFERVVAPRQRLLAVAARQEPAHEGGGPVPAQPSASRQRLLICILLSPPATNPGGTDEGTSASSGLCLTAQVGYERRHMMV